MFSTLIQFALSNLLFFALHLENNGVFPKPLSAKEEYECFQRMKEGDMTARDKLIEHNLRLVAHIIKKYYSNQRDQEDLISIGSIGLIKAVCTFDPDKGNKLASYASKCIENEILMYFRSQKKSAGDLHFDDPIDADKDGNQLTLLDIVSSSGNMIDEVDVIIKSEQLYKFIGSCLDKREAMIISLRYGLYGGYPLTQREVGKKLGISRSYVSRIEKKALAVLKRKYEKAPMFRE